MRSQDRQIAVLGRGGPREDVASGEFIIDLLELGQALLPHAKVVRLLVDAPLQFDLLAAACGQMVQGGLHAADVTPQVCDVAESVLGRDVLLEEILATLEQPAHDVTLLAVDGVLELFDVVDLLDHLPPHRVDALTLGAHGLPLQLELAQLGQVGLPLRRGPPVGPGYGDALHPRRLLIDGREGAHQGEEQSDDAQRPQYGLQLGEPPRRLLHGRSHKGTPLQKLKLTMLVHFIWMQTTMMICTHLLPAGRSQSERILNVVGQLVDLLLGRSFQLIPEEDAAGVVDCGDVRVQLA